MEIMIMSQPAGTPGGGGSRLNPIVVIGMTALIVFGLYGIYSGLEQQAELGEIQRRMLASASGAGGGAAVRGEIHAPSGSLVIMNDGPEPARVIQFRAYQQHDTALPPVTWAVSYMVGPYQTAELSSAAGAGVAALPPSLAAALPDRVLTFKGVTAQGAVFPVERPPAEAAAPPGSYGSVAVFEGGGGSASQGGADAQAAYHYSVNTGWCKIYRGGYILVEIRNIDQRPFLISSTGLGGVAPTPMGGPSWADWISHGPPARQTDYEFCGGSPCLGCAISGLAPDVAPLPGREDVYWRQLSGADHRLDLSVPVSVGAFESPYDGRMAVRVEAPTSWVVQASYELDERDFPRHCPARSTHGGENYCECLDASAPEVAEAGRELLASISTPTYSGSVTVENAAVAASSVVSIPAGVRAAESVDYDPYLTAAPDCSSTPCRCDYTLHGTADFTWSLSGGGLDGWSGLIPVRAGDDITVLGQVGVSYRPGGYGTAEGSYGRLDVGDATITVGRLVE